MPKLSIIVPIYNVEKYLSRCIESILNQTFREFELILINDGSTDNCKEICEKYKKIDSRIIVVNKKNGGVSSARNFGIDISRGEYIGFVDPDDFIDSNMYEILFNIINLYQSDIVICDYYKVSEYNIKKYEEIQLNNKGIIVENINNIDAIERILTVGEKFIFAWNKIYKRRLFENLRYNEGMIYEDEFLAHRILYRCNKVSIINSSLYYYVQRKGSIVNSRFSSKKFDKVYAIKDRVDFLKDKGIVNLIDKAEKSFIDYFVWNYFVGYQRLENIEYELKRLKKEFNSVFYRILDNKFISLNEKITLFIL
ncbi:MAG: glycosyltransferase family 2 protein, partial [Thomasclavelia spiroformis]